MIKLASCRIYNYLEVTIREIRHCKQEIVMFMKQEIMKIRDAGYPIILDQAMCKGAQKITRARVLISIRLRKEIWTNSSSEKQRKVS